MAGLEPNWCPTHRPTKQEFEQPFVDYVSRVFRENPNLPMFKVVPPANWRPRKTSFPDLKGVKINTPIRQHVFGTKGVYRCVLVEQKEMTVADFKRHALEEAARLSGHKGQAGSASAAGVADHTGSRLQARRALHSDDELQERSFWSSVTLNPPLYGADTPQSFFDRSLPFGWNLRDLGDLLKTKGVPDIPGVTTPMTYFGMWRSFFSWHKEDADLLSINYLHFGAPKVWYCVPPSESAKFDRMAAGLFPELARECSAFMRHKDILVSPSLMRTHNIKYTQAKQQPGEFVVLNAAAYHAGFNMGFNCAEAINFATKDWVAAGKAANRCTCKAMRDCVRISMKLFDPFWVDPYGDDADMSDADSGSGSEGSGESTDGSAPGCSHSHKGGRRAGPRNRLSRRQQEEESEEEDAGDEEEAADEEEEEEMSESTAEQLSEAAVVTRPGRQACGRGSAKAQASGKRGRPARSASHAGPPPGGASQRKRRCGEPSLSHAAAALAAAAAAAAASAQQQCSREERAAKRQQREQQAAAAVGQAPAPAPGARISGRGRYERVRVPASAPAAPPHTATPGYVPLPAAGLAQVKLQHDQGLPLPPGPSAPAPGEGPASQPPPGGSALQVLTAALKGTKHLFHAGVELLQSQLPHAQPSHPPWHVDAAVPALQAAQPAATHGMPLKSDTATAALLEQHARHEVGAQPMAPPGPSTASQPAQPLQPASLHMADRVAVKVEPASEQGCDAAEPLPQGPGDPCASPSEGQEVPGRLQTPAAGPPRVYPGSQFGRRAAAAAASASPADTSRSSRSRSHGSSKPGGLAGPSPGPPVLLHMDAVRAMTQEEVVGDPWVIVGENSKGRKFFNLVQQVDRPASERGLVVLRWLKEGEDGLFRPVPTYWEEPLEALVAVRSQLVSGGKLAKGVKVTRASLPAYKLLTLRSRILDTDLVD